MPVTPFHLGPGALLKSFLGKRFSFMLFGFSQAIIDLEPLYYMLTNQAHLHRFFHTYLGATVLIVPVVLLGKPLSELTLRLLFTLRRFKPEPNQQVTSQPAWKIAWTPAIIASVIGLYSHVLFDSVMHADMQPLAPLLQSNGLLEIISTELLHWVCVISGVVAVVIIFWRQRQ